MEAFCRSFTTLGLPKKERKRQGGKYCVAWGPHSTSCTNSSYSPGISLHAFPLDEPRRSEWTRFVQKYRANFTPTNSSTLCSDHFEPTSYAKDLRITLEEFDSRFKVKKFLNKDSIPTIDYQESYTVALSPTYEPKMMEKRRKIRIRDLNPQLTCMLCKGYFVNPVTITECIHTFCKSCLVRHISLINKCPACGIVIHETQPLYNIRSDRTMQDIINKILPRIEHDERKREKRFYKTKGLPYPPPSPRVSSTSPIIPKEPRPKPQRVKTPVNVQKTVVKQSSVGRQHHSSDQISLQLEYCSNLERALDEFTNGLQPLPKKFIRCSTHVTVGLLQRFIATKLQLESETLVGITHNEIEMDKDFTLKYISDNLLESKERLYPLRLQYKAIELM